MRRSTERRSVGLMAWTVGAMAVVAVLLASFALVSPARLAGVWPMGIRSAEVDAYATLLDVNMSDSSSSTVPVYYISASGRSKRCIGEDDGRGWDRRWFEGDGYGDSVKVRPLRSEKGALLVELKEGTLLREQRAFVLRPTGIEGLRHKYLELISTELGLLTPELTLVRVVACGRDLGLFLKEELVDAHFLHRMGMQDGSVFTAVFDPRSGHDLYPLIKGDSAASASLRSIWTMGGKAHPTAADVGNSVDQRALAAWLLLCWLASPEDPLSDEHVMAFRWGQRQVVPVYRSPRQNAMTFGPMTQYRSTPITVLLHDPGLRAQFRGLQDEFLGRRGQLRERAEAIERTWIPHLVEKGAMELAYARVHLLREEILLERLVRRDAFEQYSKPLERMPGWSVYGGAAVVPNIPVVPLASQDQLSTLKRMTKLRSSGDSLIFPRGRYTIAEDLLLPIGTHVVMLPGARLEIAAGRRIVCRGDLHIRGTRLNPVFIRALDAEPFVGLEVLREGQGEVRISGLQMSGGGAGGSAMLRSQGAERTSVEGAILDGAGTLLWVVGGEVTMTNGTYTGGHLAFTQAAGTLRNVDVRGATRRTGSSGLIIDGGRMRLEGGAIARSTGNALEVRNSAQVLMLGMRCEANGTAVSAVDGSLVHADGCRFLDNGTVFELRSEMATRGATRLILYTNEFMNNTRDRTVDGRSVVIEGQQLDDKVRRGDRLIP